MLTSGGQRGDGARCRALGLNAYLPKPVRQADLLRAIRLALSASGTETLITRHSLSVRPADAAPMVERPLRVLVAEDNQVNQQLAVRLLEKRGHRVTVAATGGEAVAVFDREPFDVILMDIQMPEMSGLEATAAIRSRENGGECRIPIIAMTARAMKGDREECLAAGMDDYVSKPLSPKALIQAIEALTAQRPALIPAASACDKDKLLARFDGDRTLLCELAAIFLEDYPIRIAAVRSAVERRNPAAVEAGAHALRGSAANFGAEEAVEAAAQVETMGRGGDLTGVDAALVKLERTMSQFTGELAVLAREISQ